MARGIILTNGNAGLNPGGASRIQGVNGAAEEYWPCVAVAQAGQNTLTISAPATGTTGAALAITGSVTPAGDAVEVALSTSNTVAPSSGWTSVTPSNGNYLAQLTWSTPGTVYAWAKDPVTGIVRVSAAITVAAASSLVYGFTNPGGTYPHGVSTIAIVGTVTPSQAAPTQVALSTSNTVPPTSGWEPCQNTYNNSLWAVYYPVPATAGNYYVWVETQSGGSQAVSAFTIPVT